MEWFEIFEPLNQVRSNHALEHATLHILEQKKQRGRVVGISDAGGFWLIGQLPTELVMESAIEALQRLQGGEKTLATSKNCGTLMVAPAFVAGALAWLAMARPRRNFYDTLRRFPAVVMMVLLGYELGKPLGPRLQEKMVALELSPRLQIIDAVYYKLGGMTIHRVRTRTKRIA